jgi:hypothetical protein
MKFFLTFEIFNIEHSIVRAETNKKQNLHGLTFQVARFPKTNPKVTIHFTLSY